MIPARLLPGSFALLALAACSGDPEEGGRGQSAPMPALVPQLALAGITADDAPDAVRPLRDLSPEEVRALVESGKVRLIDVRTDEEVAQGTISGAEHVAMDRFDPAAVTSSADKRPIVLYCRSGRRSAMVGEKLAGHTGEPAAHLEGGILAWEAAGLPIERND
ncbi:MAG: rhodanese-like domain-containing protein [Erythrobacter sp.]|jgi:rhodanese-related sulfurtransferase|nr:rhodanese-like domain-containing protein [Erythrobacter sp.]